MTKKNTLAFFLCTLFSFSLFAQNTDVMLQGFNWESHSNTAGWYNVVKSKAVDLGQSQIDMVWLPPSSDAAAPQGYLPRELNKLDSEYGTQAELVATINDLHAQNIKVVADIVINHRVGSTNWADFTNPTWGCWSITSNDEWGQNGGTPCGAYDTGDNYGPARDLDHTNVGVQNGLIDWMNFLKNTIGFDGWRYDYVRGYNGYYNSLYNNATNPYFSVGELWDNLDINNADAHRQQLVNWIDDTQGTSTAFDFTTKGILQQAVNGELWRLSNNGGAPGLIGWWPSNSVTFIDNHDTGSTQAHWPFPGDKVMQGYAYILTHPGIPSVFWDHFYDWGLHDEIKDLIAIRKSNGIHSTSSLDIKVAQGNLYAAEIDGKVAMKIGSGNWSPAGAGWTLAASGSNYAVWEKASAPVNDFTVYFQKPANWGAPRIHHWGAEPLGALTDSSWPGVLMQQECDDWYSFSFTGISSTNLLFHDNVNQSPDFNRTSEGWYDGQWNNTNPAPCNTGNPQSLTIHYKKPANWNSANLYYWNLSPGGTAAAWPGATMQAEGNGWYVFTIAGANCASLIFSDNGANQSADLSRCGEGWYDGTWHDIAPANNPDLVIHFKPNTYSNPNIYFWGVDNGATTSWPGESMQNDGNGWYSYTFAGADCANFIFSNNGANQTGNLSSCDEFWLDDPAFRQGESAFANSAQAIADSWKIFPHPVEKEWHTEFAIQVESQVLIKIYDVYGRVVEDLTTGLYPTGSHRFSFDTNLDAGYYILQMTLNDRSFTKPLMVVDDK